MVLIVIVGSIYLLLVVSGLAYLLAILFLWDGPFQIRLVALAISVPVTGILVMGAIDFGLITGIIQFSDWR